MQKNIIYIPPATKLFPGITRKELSELKIFAKEMVLLPKKQFKKKLKERFCLMNGAKEIRPLSE